MRIVEAVIINHTSNPVTQPIWTNTPFPWKMNWIYILKNVRILFRIAEKRVEQKKSRLNFANRKSFSLSSVDFCHRKVFPFKRKTCSFRSTKFFATDCSIQWIIKVLCRSVLEWCHLMYFCSISTLQAYNISCGWNATTKNEFFFFLVELLMMSGYIAAPHPLPSAILSLI